MRFAFLNMHVQMSLDRLTCHTHNINDTDCIKLRNNSRILMVNIHITQVFLSNWKTCWCWLALYTVIPITSNMSCVSKTLTRRKYRRCIFSQNPPKPHSYKYIPKLLHIISVLTCSSCCYIGTTEDCFCTNTNEWELKVKCRHKK